MMEWLKTAGKRLVVLGKSCHLFVFRCRARGVTGSSGHALPALGLV